MSTESDHMEIGSSHRGRYGYHYSDLFNVICRFYSTCQFFADTRMEETLLTPRNQEMVVGQNLQLPPNHLFGDNSELVVGVSPHTRWLATIKEQNAQLVTARGSPTDYSGE